jgi:hypothetical protein
LRIQKAATSLAVEVGVAWLSSIMLFRAVEMAFSDKTIMSLSAIFPSMFLMICWT